MKKSNKLIALVLAVLTMFVLFSGGLSVSAEVSDSTGESECTEITSCTCQKHQDMYTTTEPSTEAGFTLGEEDMSSLGELGGEVKGVAKILHNFFEMFNEILNKILSLADSIGGSLPDLGDIF